MAKTSKTRESKAKNVDLQGKDVPKEKQEELQTLSTFEY